MSFPGAGARYIAAQRLVLAAGLVVMSLLLPNQLAGGLPVPGEKKGRVDYLAEERVFLANASPGSSIVPPGTNGCVAVTITLQPVSLFLHVGDSGALTVGVDGTEPITYQWFKDDGPIPGATGPSLVFPDLEGSDDGLYEVLVTNCGGSIRSSRAMIFLNAAVVGVPEPGTVINFSGSLLPSGLTNIMRISAGAVHALALRNDGTVAAWGNDLADALGLTNVPPRLSNVVAVCAGDDYSLALRLDGHVVGWGNGDSASVPEGLSEVVALAGGPQRSLALKIDGTVVEWGFGATLPPGLTDVKAIAAAGDYSVIAKRDGTVELYGWPPAFVSSPITNVVSVAADQSCYALSSDGTIADLTVSGPLMPAGLTDIIALSACHGRCLALAKNGSVVGWGNVTVPTGLTNVSAIAAGGLYCLALSPNPPVPLLSAGISAGGQIQLSAPIAVSGYELEATDSLGEPFIADDLSSGVLSFGTAEDTALTLRADRLNKFYRLRKP